MEVDRAGPRRLLAFVDGLPPDAATWRGQAFPPAEEFLAVLIERQDAWLQAVTQAVLGAKRVTTPGVWRVRRPGEPDPNVRQAETDPRRIVALFRGLIGK